MKRFGIIPVAIGALVATHALVLAQTDASIGTWRLNLAKSSYSPGPSPKSNTVVIEPAGNGVKVTAKGVDAQGNPTGETYTTDYDGQDAKVTFTGSQPQDYDSIAVKRLDARKVEGWGKKGGKIVLTYGRVVSRDGDTMTVTTTGTGSAGQKVINVAVYDRQPSR